MSYEVRALAFGEILDAGFRLLQKHFVLVVGIPAVFYLPPRVAQAIWLPNAAGAIPDPTELLILLLGMGLLLLLVYPIVAAAITHAIGTVYLGQQQGIGSALGVGLRLFLPLIGTQLLAALVLMVAAGLPFGALVLLASLELLPGLLIFGLALLALVPSVYLWFAFMLVQQVMVLERRFGVSALERSHALMRGRKLRGFGVMFVSYLLVMVMSGAVGIVGLVAMPISPLLEGIASTIGTAYFSAVMVVFYFDTRCRDEAFDLEHLARLVEAEAPPPPSAHPA